MNLQLFLGRCPLCGARNREVHIRDYLADWHVTPPERLLRVLSALHAVFDSFTGKYPGSRSEVIDRAAGAIREILDRRGAKPWQDFTRKQPGRKQEFVSVECPLCEHPAGYRAWDKLFAPADEAGEFQLVRLCAEAGIVLWNLSAHGPIWADETWRVDLETIRGCLETVAGERHRVSRCPLCTRPTPPGWADDRGTELCILCLELVDVPDTPAQISRTVEEQKDGICEALAFLPPTPLSDSWRHRLRLIPGGQGG